MNYEVTKADGAVAIVDADRFEIDGGHLVLKSGLGIGATRHIAAWAPGSWQKVAAADGERAFEPPR
jgi:hypothetical protein